MADDLHPSFRPVRIHRSTSPWRRSPATRRVLDLRNRQRIEAHLVICDACLEEVIEVLRQLRPPTLPADD